MDSSTKTQSPFSKRTTSETNWTKEALQFLGAHFDTDTIPSWRDYPEATFSDIDQPTKKIRNDMHHFNLENTGNASAAAHNDTVPSHRLTAVPQASTELPILSTPLQTTRAVNWVSLPDFRHADQSSPDLRGGQRGSRGNQQSDGTWSLIDETSDIDIRKSMRAIDLNSMFETISEALTPIFDQTEPTLVFDEVNEYGI